MIILNPKTFNAHVVSEIKQIKELNFCKCCKVYHASHCIKIWTKDVVIYINGKPQKSKKVCSACDNCLSRMYIDRKLNDLSEKIYVGDGKQYKLEKTLLWLKYCIYATQYQYSDSTLKTMMMKDFIFSSSSLRLSFMKDILKFGNKKEQSEREYQDRLDQRFGFV